MCPPKCEGCFLSLLFGICTLLVSLQFGLLQNESCFSLLFNDFSVGTGINNFSCSPEWGSNRRNTFLSPRVTVRVLNLEFTCSILEK
mmetsp:Transcript_2545/g.5361  ORF Transcript_2545/g.5361 Transcript_2545/m.5361 type:complete len:87 (-) Transcript_2545:211-471(-)